jgi:hypothetical protein
MAAKSKARARAAPRHILVIDVGGTHVKLRVGAHGTEYKFVSGSGMGPERMLRQIGKLVPDSAYEAVSIGYPGLVFRGKIAAEPHNLAKGWLGFDFATAFGKPVRVVNDAAMQAIGSYRGGRMLFLGLGTGLGATLIIDAVVEPTEVGHMPYKRGLTFEDFAGERGRERLGNRKWRKAVSEIVGVLRVAFEADYVVLGGGNALRLKKLPEGAELGDNRNALIGGLRLWHSGAGALRLPPDARRRISGRR